MMEEGRCKMVGYRLSREFIAFLINLVCPTVWQFDFEPSEEGQGEDYEQQEQEDVEHGVRRHGVQRVAAEECRDKQS